MTSVRTFLLTTLTAALLQVPTNWSPDNREPRCFTVADDTFTIDPCAGWVRGAPAFDLFTARFEVRPLTPDARALFGISAPNSATQFAVAVPLTGAIARGMLPPSTLLIDLVPNAVASAQARRTDGWLAFTISRTAKGISVSLNGRELVFYNPPAARNGSVGFRVLAGAIEIRNVSYDAAGLPGDPTPSGAAVAPPQTTPPRADQNQTLT